MKMLITAAAATTLALATPFALAHDRDHGGWGSHGYSRHDHGHGWKHGHAKRGHWYGAPQVYYPAPRVYYPAPRVYVPAPVVAVPAPVLPPVPFPSSSVSIGFRFFF